MWSIYWERSGEIKSCPQFSLDQHLLSYRTGLIWNSLGAPTALQLDIWQKRRLPDKKWYLDSFGHELVLIGHVFCESGLGEHVRNDPNVIFVWACWYLDFASLSPGKVNMKPFCECNWCTVLMSLINDSRIFRLTLITMNGNYILSITHNGCCVKWGCCDKSPPPPTALIHVVVHIHLNRLIEQTCFL